jgi:hypothetical protein
MNVIKLLLGVLVLTTLFWSCTKKEKAPDSYLKSFVEEFFKTEIKKEDLIEKTSGRLKVSIESMTDDEFKSFSNPSTLVANSFEILSSACQEESCYLTYRLSYKTKSPDSQGEWSTQVKKIAHLQKFDKDWKVEDIENIKTFHETAQPLEVTP